MKFKASLLIHSPSCCCCTDGIDFAAVSVRHLLFFAICWWHYIRNKRALNGSTRFIFQLKEESISSRGGLDRPCQDRLDSFKLTWRKRRKRENTSSSPFFFPSLFEDQRCCHVSLVPLFIYQKKKEKNPFLFFYFFDSPRALFKLVMVCA